MIEITDLSVQFGGVRSLDEVTLTFPGGNCGLSRGCSQPRC